MRPQSRTPRRRAHWIGWLCALGLMAPSLWPGPAVAAGRPDELSSHPVSIEQAVRFGLAHNPLLAAAKDRRSGAEQGLYAVRGEFFPRLDAGYRHTHLSEKPIAKIPDFAGTGEIASFQTSDTTLNRWQVAFLLPLFRGFGLSAKYRIAQLELKQAEQQQEQTRLDLMLAIRQNFIRILLAEGVHDVVRKTIKQLKINRRNARSYYRQGLSPQNDVLKAEVALANASQQEKVVAQQVEILRAQLNRLLGIEEETWLPLSPWRKEPPRDEQTRVVPSLADLYRLADSRRPQLLALEAAIGQAKQQRRLAESGYYPQVSLVASAYREGDDFAASRNDFSNNQNAAIGLKVDWNLFKGGGTRAAASRAEYQAKALAKTLQDRVKQVHLEVEDAYRQLQVARSNLKTAQVAVKQAEENRRITLSQYREQVIIFSEVLDAEVYLAQARTNHLQALYGYQLAWVALERALGGPVPAFEIGSERLSPPHSQEKKSSDHGRNN